MIRLHPECIRCLTGKYLSKLPDSLTELQKIEYLQTILTIMGSTPPEDAAPVAMQRITDALADKFGLTEDYTDVKRFFNALLLRREEDFLRRLREADDPLRLGVQYAMIGNYIDFGAIENVTEEALTALIDGAAQQPIPEAAYDALRHDLERAERLVFLTDNCGEIVFDKCLLKTILSLYPQLEATVIVRGGDVSNDATMDDALQVGMPDVARVIGNGSRIAGTWLESISGEANAAIRNADVILSKGQANFETLRKCGLNVYYIFLCKCDMFAARFGVKRLTGMLINDKDCV